jgi:O-antigen polysaccharide polymerase Wzy
MKAISFKNRLPNPAIFLLPPMAVTTFLWITSPNPITLIQALAGFIILAMPWTTYWKWRKVRQTEVPLFSLIGGIYWIYYAFPLFWGDRYSVSVFKQGQAVSEEAITIAMVMAVLGVVCFWAGMKVAIGKRFVPRSVPDIPSNPLHWDWLRILLIGCAVASLFEEWFYAVSSDSVIQFLVTFLTLVPMVCYAILLRAFLRGKSTFIDNVLIIAFLVLRAITGLASGWLGAFAFVMITTAVVFIYERKRFPLLLFAVIVVYFMFFQVGKFRIRERFGTNDIHESKVEHVNAWVNESAKIWKEALTDPKGEAMQQAIYMSLSRTSLLTQTANIVELTPTVVPYQYGQTYSYLFVALIPRFVWPDKPSANDANRFYQTAYGITDEDSLSSGSFASGSMAEAYINFGWPGIMVLMFLIGVFCDWFQWTFLCEKSGFLMRGIGVALIPYLLSIEGQLAIYVGATMQRVLLILFLMIPIVRFRRFDQHSDSLDDAGRLALSTGPIS